MDITPTVQLANLADLPDYRISGHDDDPRGWIVRDSNDVVVGTVTDLIIDVDGLIARYMVCAVADDVARQVLLPMGYARLDSSERIVHLDFVTARTIAELPAFTRLPLSAAQVAQTEKALTGSAPTSAEAKIVRRDDPTRNAS